MFAASRLWRQARSTEVGLFRLTSRDRRRETRRRRMPPCSPSARGSSTRCNFRIAGRGFRATDDAASPLVVVVSQRLASRIAPNGSAIGRRVRVRVPYRSSFDGSTPARGARLWGSSETSDKTSSKRLARRLRTVFTKSALVPGDGHARGAGRERVVDAVRRAVTQIDPSLALFDVEPLTDVIDSHGVQQARTVRLARRVRGVRARSLGIGAVRVALVYGRAAAVRARSSQSGGGGSRAARFLAWL